MSQSPSDRIMLSHRLPVLGLVGPLPRQLPDRTQGPPWAPRPCAAAFLTRHVNRPAYGVLAHLSVGYPSPRVRSLTRYSAVCHYHRGPKAKATVRLACIRRAASVRPEPGSNSLLRTFPSTIQLLRCASTTTAPASGESLLYSQPLPCQCLRHHPYRGYGTRTNSTSSQPKSTKSVPSGTSKKNHPATWNFLSSW